VGEKKKEKRKNRNEKKKSKVIEVTTHFSSSNLMMCFEGNGIPTFSSDITPRLFKSAYHSLSSE
jgi:hypothetical protein